MIKIVYYIASHTSAKGEKTFGGGRDLRQRNQRLVNQGAREDKEA